MKEKDNSNKSKEITYYLFLGYSNNEKWKKY